ncbi:N-lysine methyltransferase KMT5A [Plecturocebus cupreus]
MFEPRAVEAAPGPEMVERRGPERPRTDRENVFIGQRSVPPRRTQLHITESNARETMSRNLQETRREKKGWGRSTERHEVRGTEDQRRQERSPGTFSRPKSAAAEPPKTPPSSCDSTNAAVAKQALKKPIGGKQVPRKKAQGKTQQNRKLTDSYPVGRSSRKSKAELQSEERQRIEEFKVGRQKE